MRKAESYLYFACIMVFHSEQGSLKNLHTHLNNSPKYLMNIFPILRPPDSWEVESIPI